jgi:hypothetical protein
MQLAVALLCDGEGSQGKERGKKKAKVLRTEGREYCCTPYLVILEQQQITIFIFNYYHVGYSRLRLLHIRI